MTTRNYPPQRFSADAWAEDPEPTMISADEMRGKLEAEDIHPASNLFKTVLNHGMTFATRGNEHFCCPAQGFAPLASNQGRPQPEALDLGDQVVALMLGDRGRASPAPQGTVESFLAHCQSLGPPDPQTGLRRGQDLGDAVAERLLESRGGAR